ncbi:MAG: type I DNA topoisomerase [Chloroflexota bacterium]|nr:type I DNA topoisomerase [Chloroflexota bacterium]
MAKKLVIVESPAKARTVGRILGSGYSVKASLGHIRDLSKWGLGVNTKEDFTPRYEVPKDKRPIVNEIKEAAKQASTVFVATDPDREGEAISWHLVQAAKLKSPRRVVFHELTSEAVKDAFRHPRDIDMDLVYSQQARRILDRLVGYKLSPFLWRKVRRGLSAGRVQSVTLRMVVDREREIEGFVPEEYWSIDALLEKPATKESFKAALIGVAGGDKIRIADAEQAEALTSELKDSRYAVADVRKKKASRQPAPPFTTSTLQQEGWRKLRFTARHTMAVAQQLYEGLSLGDKGSVGLITYMRTDSIRVAPSAVDEVRAFIKEKYGDRYLPSKPRFFTKKAKGAQEAHEAIRPTSAWRQPDAIKAHLTRDQFRLYQLIWKRMVASQMSAAVVNTTSVDIEARDGHSYLFRATASVMAFPGFTAVYSEGRDDAEDDKGEQPLPELSKGELVDLLDLRPEQHFTQPPPRYNEATLVKALEERGIGRPSTYAPILSTIQDRDYVEQVDGRFHPLELGFLVTDILTEYFPKIVDLGFTANMEEELDQIARGERGWLPFLQQFYDPFEKTLKAADEQLGRVKAPEEPTDEVCPECGRPMVVKWGRYGKFLSCSAYPECTATKPYLVKLGVKCPKCGGDLVQRLSKKKRVFYGCANYPECDFVSRRKPLPQPCPKCGGLLVAVGKKKAACTVCDATVPLDELDKEPLPV